MQLFILFLSSLPPFCFPFHLVFFFTASPSSFFSSLLSSYFFPFIIFLFSFHFPYISPYSFLLFPSLSYYYTFSSFPSTFPQCFLHISFISKNSFSASKSQFTKARWRRPATMPILKGGRPPRRPAQLTTSTQERSSVAQSRTFRWNCWEMVSFIYYIFYRDVTFI